MAYSYQISFNASDYVPIHPYPVEMDGSWVDNTFIWRESIKELKINKDFNSSVYETIKSYFSDSTRFETQIFIKILKDNVQESLHWFGIKWGEINHDLAYYKVTPKPYDLYGIYIENNMDKKNVSTSVENVALDLYDYTDANYAYQSTITTSPAAELLEDTIKNRINAITGFPVSSIKSCILWGDADEDGNPEITSNGLLIDYVTGEYSRLRYAIFIAELATRKDLTVNKIFEMLGLFQIYPYFDNDNNLRFEHVSRIIERLESNAINIALAITDDQFNYDSTRIPVAEEIKMYDDSSVLDTYDDFKGVPIEYSSVRNRVDTINITTNFEYYTNLTNYDLDRTKFKTTSILAASYQNAVMKWDNVDIGTYSNTDHAFDIGHSAGQYCQSKNFYGYSSFTLTVVASTLTGSMKFGIYRRSTGALVSNEVSVNSTGITTDVLILTESTLSDCMLRLGSTSASGTFTGYVFLQATGIYHSVLGAGILADPLINGDFSMAVIQDKYWRDYRLSGAGNMNGAAVTFNSTQYNLKRQPIKQYFATLPNPLDGMNDGTKIAKIDSWSRNVESGFIEMQLNYQE